MTEYNAGDLVEAVKGESLIRARLFDRTGALWLGAGAGTATVQYYEILGFTITVIEKAAPVVVLPTEYGYYRDNERDIWQLTSNGWKCLETESGLIHDPETYAPFTRLEPVSETAKKVLDKVRTTAGIGLNLHEDLKVIAADFGVEL